MFVYTLKIDLNFLCNEHNILQTGRKILILFINTLYTQIGNRLRNVNIVYSKYNFTAKGILKKFL